MRGDRPPRRAAAVLAGLSCLLLPLVGHVPRAIAASEAGDRGAGPAPAAASDIEDTESATAAVRSAHRHGDAARRHHPALFPFRSVDRDRARGSGTGADARGEASRASRESTEIVVQYQG
ncbi:hypothetical protein [Streptomyces sp. NPDC001750]|uniref:hypothetical protein n=1 Tax=unclassified Streptomyces TaxID=2593676 RepID=UPI0036BA336B